jgi:rhomboid protease GluP
MLAQSSLFRRVAPALSGERSEPAFSGPKARPFPRVARPRPFRAPRPYHVSVFLKRQTQGSVVCTSCGVLVGVNDDRCYNCGRRNPGLWGYASAVRSLGQDFGFSSFVVGAVITLYVLSLLLSGADIHGFLSPSTRILFLLGASGAIPVVQFGRWWTVLTAGWLHAGILHVLFNVLWIRQLAPTVADLYGAARMIIIYTVSGITGFMLSTTAGIYLGGVPIPFLRGAGFTVGASAAIFGLLGSLVYHGRRTGSSRVSQAGLQYAVFLGVFGLIFPGIDNYAHAGGFVGGYLAGLVLDPLKPERIDHLVIAFLCLLATVLALAVSIITALPILLG